MKNIRWLAVILLSLGGSTGWTHGEDKPGPHGGFIRMPGAFHTEVLPEAKNSLKVYLLDMQWKNPTTEKSSLVVTLTKPAVKADCTTVENFYYCEFPESVDLSQKADLKVLAKRDGQQGQSVTYPLPLKHDIPDDPHKGHH
ncbi:MAG: hypothetical protein A2622_00410 [Bdellovibrionales bacterium RIFCSPHIGHO2_01_FULL_40_29]|nr:MAG: hypothetical protein A2622_00410 [Bdellovibrionales bacterium RIFCSPHIGHO2_01_FULL_40_29]OFZ32586.1 MAG: hypothetical protein A3D17_05010 [Bdellovibrionales bacterium RIFCSPHIGHO2_02_FULL_40_15]